MPGKLRRRAPPRPRRRTGRRALPVVAASPTDAPTDSPTTAAAPTTAPVVPPTAGGIRAKIKVHGYCASTDPFPSEHFTPGTTASFDGAGGVAQAWSHDTFARKIHDFATEKNISGCSCIAHSQGGAACLHLKARYWSCLDETSGASNAATGGGRLIQSVGTPYRGTNLAGNAAVLGDIFGAGCGYNADMTHDGADAWLANLIPAEARAAVHYHTTSFTEVWWQYNYCHIATDLLLSDPDDGTVERGRGQLAGGNNRGHKIGQCHTATMGELPQCQDAVRNADMDANAVY